MSKITIPKDSVITIEPYNYPSYNNIVSDIIQIEPNVVSPKITFSPAPTMGNYKNCIIRIDGSEGSLEYFAVDSVDGMQYDEELRLREENAFVKELYEQYRVALILAHGGN